jgi:SAM-dependent methyltransferase
VCHSRHGFGPDGESAQRKPVSGSGPVGENRLMEMRSLQAAKRGQRLHGLNKKDGFLPHPFDLENGVRTSGLIVGRHLKTGSPRDRQTTAYYGVAPSVFHALVRRWRRVRPAHPLEETTFLDIGAGMGRAVLLAAEMNFRAVLGVEMHPALVRIARRNLTIWRKAGREAAPMRMIEADATEFAFPQGPCVAFLFNPFGAAAMRRFLRHAARSFRDRPGSLDILYVNNEQEGVFEEMRGFVRFYSGRIRRSPSDAKADHAILSNQPDGEYASADYEDCSIWRWQG